MTARVELPDRPRLSQRLLAGVLRSSLRLLFRGLVRPPMPIAGQRAIIRGLTATSVAPRDVERSSGTLAGRACEWHRPAQDSGRVLLYLHGGAYLIGSPATHRSITGNLAKRCAMAVCALDYRLAPEHPYPAALEDALAAYRELLGQGYTAAQIVIGGDSAGGNLSLITALRLKQLGLPLPAALVCFSPWTDASCSQLHKPPAGDPLLHPAWIQQAVGLYCPAGMDRRDPGLSPVYADLTGLPPLLIQVGEDELLLNDSLRFAEQADAAGVTVKLERYAGLWHVFQAHAGLLDVADLALIRVADFLQQPGR
ncbi:alpha/beta hydrolase [Pseudomonas sp. 2FE]|uniref:alpha/beta hydrolase n=1 Tax=Pseudomonas sp. 2FE TaxID=2502190 RepID=UPI0010F7A008|nr:alpha/beta hydrolase [Pseudomonas sp. 2FE]